MIEYLEWDSSFFQKRIYKVQAGSSFDPEELGKIIAGTPADVFYLFSEKKLDPGGVSGVRVLEFGGNVEFEKQTGESITGPVHEIIEMSSASEDLYELAERSGAYSRFRLDPGFAPDFSRMYRYWLDRAFRSPDYTLLAAAGGGELMGLLLYSRRESSGRIELLAVKDSHRGKGVGSALVRRAEGGIQRMRVATQMQNRGGCSFYRACGYRELTETYIWHLWKN